MTFVTFHASLNPETETALQSKGIHLAAASTYERQINWLLRSAEFYFPGCRMVVITDLETQFDDVIHDRLQGPIELFRANAPGHGAMLTRARAQVEWLEHEQRNQTLHIDPILLVDSDMIINGSLDELRASDYDVALTYRTHRKMPINGGVFIIAPGKIDEALRFSRWVEDIYTSTFPNDLWFGHQRSLIVASGSDDFEASDKRSLMARCPLSSSGDDRSVRLKLLPVEQWNHTVDVRMKAMKAFRNARILHFKGSRKLLMGPYFSASIHPNQELSKWLSFYWTAMIQRWRRKLAKRGKIIQLLFAKISAPFE